MKKLSFILAFIFITNGWIEAAIQTEEVRYGDGDTVLNGYLAYDDALEGKRPGILVVHEWWGHNDYARKRARMLAELGYTALAVDMYGDGKLAEHPDTAGQFSGAVMSQIDSVGKARFLAALDLLKQHETVNADKTAAIGYCFGGGTVLHMARSGVDIDGVVSFHGSLSSKVTAEPGTVKARILVCHGADDSFIPPEAITAFKSEMETANADYQFISYEGAVHSFTNPQADELARKFGLGIAYNEAADQNSWADMQAFFGVIFE